MRRQLIASDEAVQAKCQHTVACSDCPWRRDALPGWLGSNSAEEWVQIAHGDAIVECHTLLGAQCAGIATYRTNVCKSARPPNMKLPKDTELVFAWPPQFLEHHNKTVVN
jgi:hypothetical protein